MFQVQRLQNKQNVFNGYIKHNIKVYPNWIMECQKVTVH